MQNHQTAVFHGNTQVSIIDHNGQFWLTAEDVGHCLGYGAGNERKGIIAVYNRHIDEFLPEDTCVVNLTTQGQGRDFRVFSKTGCIKLGFFASTPLARHFRTWAAKVLSSGSPEAALLVRYKAAYLLAAPQHARLIDYYNKGLTLIEIGKLLDISADAARHRVKKLAALGLVEYRPNPVMSESGKRAQAKRLLMRAQQVLDLEG